jgi:hypothetical protein
MKKTDLRRDPVRDRSRLRSTLVDAQAPAMLETVREWARDFPDVEEGTMYGSPAVKLGKRLVACVAVHRSAEPGSLVVRTDFEERAALLAEDPGTYYVTDHYVNHPLVLVRLGRVQEDQLRDLLGAARRFVLAGAARSQKTRPPARRGRVTRE